MKQGRLALISCIFALSISVAAAESNPWLDGYVARGFPENTDVRKQFWTSLITVPKESAFAFKERVLSSRPVPVKVSSTRRSNDFIIQFQNGADGAFSAWSRGSFSIERDSSTGYFLQVKVFLQDDPSCYLRLYPQAEATRMDVVMYGAVIKKGLYLPGLVYYVLSDSFANIVGQTKGSFDWAKVFGNGQGGPTADFADRLRAALPPPSPPAQSAAPSPQASGMTPAVGASVAESQGMASVPPRAIPVGPALPAAPVMVTTPPRPLFLASLVARTGPAEALAAGLSAHGESWSELLPSADAPPLALGLSDDGDPFVSRMPYRPFPRYEAGKGWPFVQLRAALYLDALQSPSSVYAVVGESLRVLAVPSFDASGHFRIAFFSDTREMAWEDLLSTKEGKIRLFRFSAED